jgi:hypothetical protein
MKRGREGGDTLCYRFYRSLFLRKTSCNKPYKVPLTFQNSAVPLTN